MIIAIKVVINFSENQHLTFSRTWCSPCSRWPWSDLFKVTKGQTDYAILFATYDFLSVFYNNYSAISHGSPFSADDLDPTFQGHQRSNWLCHLICDLWLPICVSIVTIALSRTETLFFSRWPWSGLSRSPKVKLIMPFDLRPMTSYKCSLSNYSAISHGNPVFQQMTLIWPFKVTKGQTDYSIRSAIYDFLLTFYSNYSAISLRSRYIRRQTSEDLAENTTFDLLKVIDLNWFLVSLDRLLALSNALHMRNVALISVLPFALYIYLFSKNSRNIKTCLK